MPPSAPPARSERHAGSWLFRHRSWFPPLLLVIPVVGLALTRAARPTPGLPSGSLAIGVLIAFVGLGVRAYTVGTAAPGTSGRNTLAQIADHLNTTGPYSVVRHPLYLGTLLTWIGLTLATGVWWAVVVTLVAFGGFYGRITRAEEYFLDQRFGDDFRIWARATPAFVPALQQWRAPAYRFAPSIAARQEYYGWTTVTCCFVLLELAAQWIDAGQPSIGWPWLVIVGTVIVTSAVLRYLQRHTTRLDVPGR